MKAHQAQWDEPTNTEGTGFVKWIFEMGMMFNQTNSFLQSYGCCE